MTTEQIDQSDQIFRWRRGTLMSVDDMIGRIFGILDAYNETQNTYFFFTSDNVSECGCMYCTAVHIGTYANCKLSQLTQPWLQGFHLGEFAMGYDKRQLYESDIRIPYVVFGPGIPANATASQLISHVDLAPTIIDIVTGAVPETWDGQSFKAVLYNTSTPFREYVLVQYFGESQETEFCGCGISGFLSSVCDQWNNTYSCLRTITNDGSQNDIFCQFGCFNNESMEPVPCPMDEPEGYGEYYNLVWDPYQMTNTMLELGNQTWYTTRLATLSSCSGQASCNTVVDE